MKEWVIRIVQTKTDQGEHLNEGGIISNTFLGCLQSCGYVEVHPIYTKGLTIKCFDIISPKDIKDTYQWAIEMSMQLRDCGFNAVATPRT